MGCGDSTDAEQRHGDRNPCTLGKLSYGIRGARKDHTVSGEDHRPFCTVDQTKRRRDCVGIQLGLGPGEPGELESAFKELVRRRSRQGEHARVPALELGKPAARADLGLEQADIALGEDDLVLHLLERRAL